MFVLSAHVVLAGLALRFLPHGFPFFHPRSVLGTFAPACIAAAAVALGAALAFVSRAGMRWVAALPAFWASVALGLWRVFPVTGSEVARPMGAAALVLAAVAWWTTRSSTVLELLPAVVVGAAAGQVVARCERPAAPSTRPWPGEPPRGSGGRVSGRWALGPVSVEGSTLGVSWHGQAASVLIAPLLEFDRTSPDVFWSIFTGEVRAVPAVSGVTPAPDALRFWAADGRELLAVEQDGSAARLDAWTLLERPVYSHLNSFTTVRVSGHRRLGLRFSPCSSALIEVTHADYPTGAPARFAYVDTARRFHVMQAADAEKGPFTPLAEGVLREDETLGVDLVELDEETRAFAHLEFVDFAAQLSTALSPTAGYGVSENAVEFGLDGESPRSSAHLVLTLAASGIGRGWDSVGHRAGAYRNRVLLRPLEPPPELMPEAPLDARTVGVCNDIARDIAGLKSRFSALAAFDPDAVGVREGECSIDYRYRTHSSTVRGGWRAQVPEPDADGVWFHLGIWDPAGPAQRDPVNTQPGLSVYSLGDENMTVLILDGAPQGRLAAELMALLKRHGLGALRR